MTTDELRALVRDVPDFPHEGIVDMSKAVDEFLRREDIPAPAKRKISYANPKRLYGL